MSGSNADDDGSHGPEIPADPASAAADADFYGGQYRATHPLEDEAESEPSREWTAHAACATMDPELFASVRPEDESRAKQICMTCPVRTECLADALDNKEAHGIWGGMTPRERAALLARRPDIRSWKALLFEARQQARGRIGDALRALGA